MCAEGSARSEADAEAEPTAELDVVGGAPLSLRTSQN